MLEVMRDKIRRVIRRIVDRDQKNTDTSMAGHDTNSIVNAPKLKGSSRIIFEGKHNVLYCAEPGLSLEGTTISFKGDNAIVYLSASRRAYQLKVEAYNDSVVYVGGNNYYNGPLRMIASEQRHIIIGGNGLFSFGCWVRTADPHLVYDSNTHKRINPSKNVIIGDHVWLGQSAFILKGTTIGSGTIIGAASVVSGKLIASNTVYAGNPAKLIKSEVFFSGESVHRYRQQETKMSMTADSDEWIYGAGERRQFSPKALEKNLAADVDSKTKLEYIRSTLAKSRKNRFFVADKDGGSKK